MYQDSEDKMEQKINEGLALQAYRHFDVEKALDSFKALQKANEKIATPVTIGDRNNNINLFFLLKYAAVIFAVVVVFGLISKPVQFVETAITLNETKIITLFDGSIIEMDKNTILTYPVREKDIVIRKVTIIKGKVTFKVMKNKELPFVVATLPIETTMTGTIFTVGKQKGEVSIQVLEGSVSVHKIDDKTSSFEVRKGEEMFLTKGEIFHKDEIGNVKQLTAYIHPVITPKAIEKLVIEKKENIFPKSTSSGSTYRLSDVFNYLQKTYKKRLKFNKKRKLKTRENISVDLQQDLATLLQDIEKQGFVKVDPGKCDGCFILSPPEVKN